MKTGDRVFIDAPCINLCEALNRLPGISTIGSCSGHNRSCFAIIFLAETQDRMRPLLRVLRDLRVPDMWTARGLELKTMECFDWSVTLDLLLVHDQTSIALGRPRFSYKLKGPTGETAYKQAEVIADSLTLYRKRKWRTYPTEEQWREIYKKNIAQIALYRTNGGEAIP